MKRRRGVIAALLGGVMNSYSQSTYPTELRSNGLSFRIDLQRGNRLSGFCRASQPLADGSVTCVSTSIPEPEFVIEVRYGDRVVKLTASDVMDALEAK